MISYLQALKLIEKNCKKKKANKMDLKRAEGLIVALDVKSPTKHPPFDNSAMDGFAVIANDTLLANRSKPIQLKIANKMVAGDKPKYKKYKSEKKIAFEIMTGAIIEKPFNAVVPYEQTNKKNKNFVTISSKINKHANIRNAGEDFGINDLVIKNGEKISPQHQMACAALGIPKIVAYSKPKISVFSTGKELVNSNKKTLAPGKIRNSNGLFLKTAIPHMGAEVKFLKTNLDNEKKFTNDLIHIVRMKSSDVIISTGAVSAGKYDFVPRALKKAGAKIIFHKVSIRPGRPMLFAKFSNGTAYFGLPGNPISVAVGLRFFVYPYLRSMQGLKREVFDNAILENERKTKKGFLFFQKARKFSSKKGNISVKILPKQQSAMIEPFTKSNCWAILGEKNNRHISGSIINIAPLYSCEYN